MPVVVDLATAKAHLRVDHSDEDSLITGYIEAAEAHASEYMGRPLDPWNEDEDPAPATVKQAILLAVGDFYENREAANQEKAYEVNPAFRSLLNWHRLGMGI